MGSVVERLRHEADEAERRAAQLRRMIELVTELGEDGLAELAALASETTNGNGNATARQNGNGHKGVSRQSTPEAPRGREAIRRIVKDRPGVWTLAELQAAMRENGWFTSARGVEVAVIRMTHHGEARRDGRGRYVFPANHGEEGAIESEPSDRAMTLLTR